MKSSDKVAKPIDSGISKKGKAGGPSSLDRKKYGRNMAGVMNQMGKLGKGK